MTTPDIRILIGFDGSDDSMAALEFAATEAAVRSGVLHIVYAVDDTVLNSAWGIVFDVEAVRRGGLELLERAREIAHARGVAVVIEDHVALAARHGLDGVHLTKGARGVRHARKELGADAIVGAFCGASRHDGMNAGEMGADYVAFGPAGSTALGTGERAGRDLFAWWTEMIELPVVAEGALDPATVAELESVTDFFAFGEEIWRAADPAAALKALIAEMG